MLASRNISPLAQKGHTNPAKDLAERRHEFVPALHLPLLLGAKLPFVWCPEHQSLRLLEGTRARQLRLHYHPKANVIRLVLSNPL